MQNGQIKLQSQSYSNYRLYHTTTITSFYFQNTTKSSCQYLEFTVSSIIYPKRKKSIYRPKLCENADLQPVLPKQKKDLQNNSFYKTAHAYQPTPCRLHKNLYSVNLLIPSQNLCYISGVFTVPSRSQPFRPLLFSSTADSLYLIFTTNDFT